MKKLKEKITPIDDDGAKIHCSLANSVLTPWESTVKAMSHWCQSQTISQLDSRWWSQAINYKVIHVSPSLQFFAERIGEQNWKHFNSLQCGNICIFSVFKMDSDIY